MVLKKYRTAPQRGWLVGTHTLLHSVSTKTNQKTISDTTRTQAFLHTRQMLTDRLHVTASIDVEGVLMKIELTE